MTVPSSTEPSPKPDQAVSQPPASKTETVAGPWADLGLKQFAPLIWVAIVWFSFIVSLYAVGYLDVDPETKNTPELERLEKLISSPDIDYGARRAAMAFSGITLTLTFTATLLGGAWAYFAFRNTSKWYGRPVLVVCALFLALVIWAAWEAATNLQPFTTRLGKLLLQFQCLRPKNCKSESACSILAAWVPYAMFFLSCAVPCVLLAGATFLLEPLKCPTKSFEGDWAYEALRKTQVTNLLRKVRELDQMLYIGALTLVFGTLQLSAGLSVPLVSMPKASAVKVQADVCKMVAPAASAPAFFSANDASSDVAKRTDEICQEVPKRFSQVDSADSLRQLAKGITLCFGLAFSALLAAVYVPAFIGLRMMIEERNTEVDDATTKALGEVDPLHRLAALSATLSPLFAGLLANTLAGS